MDYASAKAELIHKGHGRPMESRKMANNTYLVRRGDDIALRLHNTDVITFHSNLSDKVNTATYNTGGWYTVTTKERMNWAAPRIWSDRGTWWISVGPHHKVRFWDGVRINLRTEGV